MNLSIMKKRFDIKSLACALSLLILLQSCNIYYTSPATVDEAVSSADKVKIVSPDQETYKFNRIVKIDSLLYGYTKNKSAAAKKLSGQIIFKEADSKTAKIQLYDHNINTIYLKNKTGSTIVSIAIPVVIVGVLVGIGYAAADNVSIDMQFN